MTDPRAPSRRQLERIAGNDPETIRLLERLFKVAGQLTPADIQTIFTELDGAAQAPVADDAGRYADVLRDTLQAPIGGDGAMLARIADDLMQAPPAPVLRRPRYGQFLDTTTQTAALPATAYALTFNTTSYSRGVYVGSPSSRIYADTSALYDFQISAQFDKTSGGLGLVNIWFRKNGVDIPDSASRIRIQGNDAEVFTGVNFLIQMNAGDYIEVMWETDSTDVEIAAFPATAVHPAIPSIILTATNNFGDVQ